MDIAIGQTKQYLYRRRGKEFPVDATITDINGKHITITFPHPQSGRLCQRVLRTARERVRLIGVPTSRPGAPAKNQNASFDGPHKVSFTITLSGKRLTHLLQRLEQEEKAPTARELRSLVYKTLDAQRKEIMKQSDIPCAICNDAPADPACALPATVLGVGNVMLYLCPKDYQRLCQKTQQAQAEIKQREQR